MSQLNLKLKVRNIHFPGLYIIIYYNQRRLFRGIATPTPIK